MATQKGNFKIERTKIINSPKSVVFNYINDYKNWSDFNSWLIEDSGLKIVYPQKTVGLGSSFSWTGKEGDGEIKTVFIKENDSIAQKMVYNRTTSDINLSFKETNIGTKLTVVAIGKMGFKLKIYTFLNGGIDYIIGENCDKTLANLDKALNLEVNSFNVKVDGEVKKTETFYIKQSFTSKIVDIDKNRSFVFTKLINFCKLNNIDLNGKPFLIYHSIDILNKVARLSFCIPIKNEFTTITGNEFTSGKLASFEAIKTTLTGNYTHMQKALDKSNDYFKKNRIQPDSKFSHIEVYSIGKNEIKNQSKWVTQIYYPIKPIVTIVKPQVIVPTEVEIVNPTNKDEESEF